MKEQFIIVTKEGSKFYYKDEEFTILHREDGPAVERFDGSKSWCKVWIIDGKRHRTDGPAIEFADGTKLWFIDGKELLEKVFNATVLILKMRAGMKNCDDSQKKLKFQLTEI